MQQNQWQPFLHTDPDAFLQHPVHRWWPLSNSTPSTPATAPFIFLPPVVEPPTASFNSLIVQPEASQSRSWAKKRVSHEVLTLTERNLLPDDLDYFYLDPKLNIEHRYRDMLVQHLEHSSHRKEPAAMSRAINEARERSMTSTEKHLIEQLEQQRYTLFDYLEKRRNKKMKYDAVTREERRADGLVPGAYVYPFEKEPVSDRPEHQPTPGKTPKIRIWLDYHNYDRWAPLIQDISFIYRCTLPIGDIVYQIGRDMVRVIEHKELSDFSSGVGASGSEDIYRQQRTRLSTFPLPNHRKMYLIENPLISSSYARVEENTLESAKHNLMSQWGFTVYTSEGGNMGTVLWLLKSVEMICRNGDFYYEQLQQNESSDGFHTSHDYVSAIGSKKIDYETGPVIFKRQLKLLRGVTDIRVDAIQRRFPGAWADLYQTLQQLPDTRSQVDLLSEMELYEPGQIVTTKIKRIGAACATRLVAALYGFDPKTTDQMYKESKQQEKTTKHAQKKTKIKRTNNKIDTTPMVPTFDSAALGEDIEMFTPDTDILCNEKQPTASGAVYPPEIAPLTKQQIQELLQQTKRKKISAPALQVDTTVLEQDKIIW